MSDAAPGQRVSLSLLFRTFFVLGATSFGGGVVAYLREALVEERGWLDDEEFLGDLELSQTLPGLNATNMSVIVGDRLRGAAGATVAFLGMTLPGTAVVLALSALYGVHGEHPVVNAMLKGIAAAAVGLLLSVTLQIGRKQVSGIVDFLLLLVTFLAVGVFHAHVVWTILAVAPVAVLLHRPRAKRDTRPA